MLNTKIGHFQKYDNTLCLFSKILQKHCSHFLLGPIKSQEKMETMFMQNFGGETKSIIYGIFECGLFDIKQVDKGQNFLCEAKLTFQALALHQGE